MNDNVHTENYNDNDVQQLLRSLSEQYLELWKVDSQSEAMEF